MRERIKSLEFRNKYQKEQKNISNYYFDMRNGFSLTREHSKHI